MPRYQSPTAEFARRGFDDATASARVWERWAERLGTEPPVSLSLLERVSDRDQALEALDRFEAADPALFARIAADPDWLQRLLLVLGGSTLSLRRTSSSQPSKAWLLPAPLPKNIEVLV